jgi:hypothetical protein
MGIQIANEHAVIGAGAWLGVRCLCLTRPECFCNSGWALYA